MTPTGSISSPETETELTLEHSYSEGTPSWRDYDTRSVTVVFTSGNDTER